MSATVRLAVVAFCSVAIVNSSAAQETTGKTKQQTGVAMSKLAPPVYPPLARQARISGDVVLKVSVSKDGSIQSVDLFSGHPMLIAAATRSAKQSTFECRGCEETTSYLLTYTFKISAECPHFGPNCEFEEGREPEVTQLPGRITLIVEPACACDPVVTITRARVRAARGLYLWKCGFGEVTAVR